jgi:hypothetical protein
MKRLNSVETEQYQLEVVECDCGYHMGIDATYLDQVGDVLIECPSCGMSFDTSVVCSPNSEYLSSDSIRIKWSIGDVLVRAEKLNIPIDEDEARRILVVIKKNHDATIGINTEVIDCYIEMFDSSRIDEAING